YGKFVVYHRRHSGDYLGNQLFWWVLHRRYYPRAVSDRDYRHSTARHPGCCLDWLPEQQFSDAQIFGERDFQITGIPVHQGDGVPFFLDHGSIVSERFILRLLISLAQDGAIEDLRRLHQVYELPRISVV